LKGAASWGRGGKGRTRGMGKRGRERKFRKRRKLGEYRLGSWGDRRP